MTDHTSHHTRPHVLRPVKQGWMPAARETFNRLKNSRLGKWFVAYNKAGKANMAAGLGYVGYGIMVQHPSVMIGGIYVFMKGIEQFEKSILEKRSGRPPPAAGAYGMHAAVS